MDTETGTGGAAAAMQDPLAMGGDGEQYLTFRLGDEEYGVDILRVEEIKGWEGASRIPNAPEHVRGVMNVRGSIVPVIDLRLRFGLPGREYDRFTVVVMVRVESDGRTRVVGLVVDALAEVYALPADSIRPAPDLGESVKTDFIRGLASVEERMVVLLEVDRLLDAETLAVGPALSAATEDSHAHHRGGESQGRSG
ncbi:chemotaxis protein CheW [Spiribacter halobius]